MDHNDESMYAFSDDESMPLRGKSSQRKPNTRLRIVAILAVVGYLILGVHHINLWLRFKHLESQLSALKPELFPSLAESHVFRRESRVFPLTIAGTPFAGVPSPELDQAWHDLIKGSYKWQMKLIIPLTDGMTDTTIRVAREDLNYYNVTSLPLKDGSGFASEIFMTHELHCLKKIRQWIYKETYFQHVQGPAREELEKHINHCIETLRQGVMCRGDVSLGTYTYLSGSKDVTARSWGSHQCVDFDALISWTKARAIDLFETDILVKPEDLGPEHITQRIDQL